MYDVIALGELLVDLAERSKDEAGYPTLAANPGGAPGNFLAALSAYGKKTAFLAKVGDDTFGRLLVGTMQRAGIDGRGGMAAVFDGLPQGRPVTPLKLTGVQPYESGAVWLRYAVEHS